MSKFSIGSIIHFVEECVKGVVKKQRFGAFKSKTLKNTTFIKLDREKLLDAAKEGDFDTVKNMTKGVDINDLPRDLVLLAALSDNIKLVKYLVEDLQLDYKKEFGGATPLVSAAFAGNKEIAAYFIKKGVSMAGAESYSDAPVDAAARAGHPDMLKFLLKECAPTTGKTLKNAILYKDVKIAEGMLKLLAEGNHLSAHVQDPHDADTILSHAISRNSKFLVKMVLESGEDANQPFNSNVSNPLMTAVEKGNIDIVKLLLDYKANPNQHNKWGETPLHRAIGDEDPINMSKLLISKGAKVGDLELERAASKGIEVFKYMLKHGEPTESAKLVLAATRADNIEVLELIKDKFPTIFSNGVEKGMEGAIDCNYDKIIKWFFEAAPEKYNSADALEKLLKSLPDVYTNDKGVKFLQEKLAELKSEATKVTALTIYTGDEMNKDPEELKQAANVEEIHTESDFNH